MTDSVAPGFCSSLSLNNLTEVATGSYECQVGLQEVQHICQHPVREGGRGGRGMVKILFESLYCFNPFVIYLTHLIPISRLIIVDKNLPIIAG